jgi:hypothetical protein
MHQFLTTMHRVRISSWCVCSAYFEGAVVCACICSWCVCSVHRPVPDSYAHVRINSLRLCSVLTSVPYMHAQHVLKGPLQIWNFYAYAEHTRKKLMRMLRVRIVPNPCAQVMHQFLTHMHRVRISSWCVCSAYFERAVLCARICSWCVCSVHAPVPDSYAHVSISSWYACSVHASLRVCSAHASVPCARSEGIQN